MNNASSFGGIHSCVLERTWTHTYGTGDFQLFHKSLLETYKTAGYLENNQNFGLDSEFVFRNIYKYKRRGYLIKNCNLCHQPHKRPRVNKNEKTPCDQVFLLSEIWPQFKEMIEFTNPNQFQNDHPFWKVANFTENWGFPDQVFGVVEL